MGKHYANFDTDERYELYRPHEAGTAPGKIAMMMVHRQVSLMLKRNSLLRGGYKQGLEDAVALSRCRRQSELERMNPMDNHFRDRSCYGMVAGTDRRQAQARRIRV